MAPCQLQFPHDVCFVLQGPLDLNAQNLMSPPIAQNNAKIFSSLYVKNSRPENSGKYTCVADTMTHRVPKSYTVKVESSSSTKPQQGVFHHY